MNSMAAKWFHERWNIPLSEYQDSINLCVSGCNTVPQWYVALCGDVIVGGAGVIENDSHDRKDLSPNVCALYVDKPFRCRGMAGDLLQHVCRDMVRRGVNKLYLVTDHTGFYERYGWRFLCMARDEVVDAPVRVYDHGR